MTFSTAYTDFGERRTIANIFTAKDEFDAMIEAIVSNYGEDMREWLNKLPREKNIFLDELLKIDISVNAIPIV